MIWFSASCNFTILPNSLGLPALPRSKDKLLSVFEPSTEVIRKGAHRDHWQGCRRTLCHPHRQQSAAAIRLFDYKVRSIAMNQAPESNDAFSGARMMRIMDDNFEQMFLCIMSLA